MSDRRLRIARRELAGLGKEKTIVLALLIQLFIAAFSSFLVVGLVSLYDPGSVEGETQVEAAVSGDAVDDLLAVVEEEPGITATAYASERQARDAFDRGQADAVLVADRGPDERIHVRATVPGSNIQTTLVVVQVRDALAAYERVERGDRSQHLESTPLALPPEDRTSPYYGFTYTVLIPLLLFLPVFISGSIAVDSMAEEIDRGTLELLLVTPASLSDVLEGKVLAAAGLAPAQAVLWIALLRVNGTAVGNPGRLLVLVSGLALIVVALGVLIALVAPDRRVAQFVYSLGALVLFGGATLTPFDPVNVAAQLAIDSPGELATPVVVMVAVLGAVAYLAIRGVTGRVEGVPG